MYIKNRATVKRRDLSLVRTKMIWSYLLLLLAPVAGLDACVVQADEILAVLIPLKTEFQRLFRRDLCLRPVRIREARICVFPEIARGV